MIYMIDRGRNFRKQMSGKVAYIHELQAMPDRTLNR